MTAYTTVHGPSRTEARIWAYEHSREVCNLPVDEAEQEVRELLPLTFVERCIRWATGRDAITEALDGVEEEIQLNFAAAAALAVRRRKRYGADDGS